MKPALYWSTAALFVGLCSALCSGQCANNFGSIEFHCDGPGGCSDDVTVFIPEGDEYGFTVGCGSVSCCGQLFSTCWPTGGCNPDMLKNPGVKEEIARLAATSEVLVADCKGRYVPYEPPAYRALAADDQHLRANTF